MRNELLQAALDASAKLVELARRDSTASSAKKAGMASVALYLLSGPIGKSVEDVAHQLPDAVKTAVGKEQIDDFECLLVDTESESIAARVAWAITPRIGAERREIHQSALIEAYKGKYLKWVESRSIIPFLRVLKVLENRGPIEGQKPTDTPHGMRDYDLRFQVRLVGRNRLFTPVPKTRPDLE